MLDVFFTYIWEWNLTLEFTGVWSCIADSISACFCKIYIRHTICYKIVRQLRSPCSCYKKTWNIISIYSPSSLHLWFSWIFPQMLLFYTRTSTDQQIQVVIAIVDWENTWGSELCSWRSVTENVYWKQQGLSIYLPFHQQFCMDCPFCRRVLVCSMSYFKGAQASLACLLPMPCIW